MSPRVLSFDQFAAEQGYGESFISEPGMHRGRAGQSERAKRAALARLAKLNAEHSAIRRELILAYARKIDAGEIRPPTHRERLEQIAAGHPDNPSVQASRRLLARLKVVP